MLRLESISAGYGDGLVLRDLSLVVPAGSVTALLGPNGAGKTTLLRVASGLLRPRGGKVILDGDDVTRRSPEELASVGVCHVPEGRGVFPSLTVQENLELFAESRTASDAVGRAVAAFPALGAKMGQTVGTMSGGEQQMVALARAYVRENRIVLLDEVSMGLAPRIIDDIYGFLGRLAKEGRALLLVEQFVTKALGLADYVYILSRGRVSFAGDASELSTEDILSRYLGDAALVGDGVNGVTPPS